MVVDSIPHRNMNTEKTEARGYFCMVPKAFYIFLGAGAMIKSGKSRRVVVEVDVIFIVVACLAGLFHALCAFSLFQARR